MHKAAKLFALLISLAFVAPASAAVIGGTDYTLFGKTHVKLEDGPVKITGNIGVNDPGGFIRIGAQNQIFGIARADTMFFGTGAHVDVCEFNTSTGGNPNAVCGVINPNGPPTFPLVPWPPLPIPVVTTTNNNIICPANGTLPLAPGNYGNLDIKDNCTLTLQAGVYNFKKVRQQTGSLLDGNGATINSAGSYITEPGVTIDSVTVTTINAGTFESIVIGNDSTINNSLFFAANARMHLHQGGKYTNSEFVAIFITVEPIETVNNPVLEGCACIGKVVKGAGGIELTNGCHLNASTNTFFVSTTCAIDASVSCPGANCIAATVQAGATDTTATLNFPAAPAGTYHVIVKSPGGFFCTTDTVILP